jgi:superfamily II DNA/RNA helicase
VANRLLKNPTSVALAANNERHKSIQQHIHHADSKVHKQKLLEHHLNDARLTKTLIFTATKRGADQLAKVLRSKDHKSAALHGDMSQNKRRQTVENLKKGRVEMLVATDVAARGLDIKEISHVINFDLPMVAEDYIHRIGRTGRAGATGCAISLVGSADWQKLGQIEKLTGQKIKREVIEGLEPTGSEPKSKPGAKDRPKSKRKFSRNFKAECPRKPGHWRKGSAGTKRAKPHRVKKAA